MFKGFLFKFVLFDFFKLYLLNHCLSLFCLLTMLTIQNLPVPFVQDLASSFHSFKLKKIHSNSLIQALSSPYIPGNSRGRLKRKSPPDFLEIKKIINEIQNCDKSYTYGWVYLLCNFSVFLFYTPFTNLNQLDSHESWNLKKKLLKYGIITPWGVWVGLIFNAVGYNFRTLLLLYY